MLLLCISQSQVPNSQPVLFTLLSHEVAAAALTAAFDAAAVTDQAPFECLVRQDQLSGRVGDQFNHFAQIAH